MIEEDLIGYDIIGDVHGHADVLESLLLRLGYRSEDGCYRHSQRKAIFVGDLIDRGPRVRETLQLVKAMWDRGSALVTVGNHEYNAVCYCTQDESGNWLRAHTRKNTRQFQATLDAFRDYSDEWSDYLSWFRSLPLFLDVESFRVVHACWSQRHIDLIGDRRLEDEGFLRSSAIEGTDEFEAIETVLKGPELALPEGITIADKEGTVRSKVRTKWWIPIEGRSYRDMAFPEQEGLPTTKINPGSVSDRWDVYPEKSLPVFVGHYWLPPQRPAPYRNVVCLDYSVAKDGFLTAYRWTLGKEISAEGFVTTACSSQYD